MLTNRYPPIAAPPIRLVVHWEHVAKVLRARRELGIGEGIRRHD